MRRREDIMVPDAIAVEYPNAVAYLKEDGEIIFTAEVMVGGMDDEGVYLIVQGGPATGEKGYVGNEW